MFHVAEYVDRGTPSFPTALPDIASEVLYFLILFYLFMAVRYVRTRAVALDREIAPVLAGGDSAYDDAFGGLTRSLWIIMIAILLGTIASTLTLVNHGTSAVLVYTVFSNYFAGFAYATFIWVYAAASFGVHKLGRSRLRLVSPFDDRMMGIGSTGNLALSLTGAYFGGLLLLILLFSSALLTDPLFQTVVVAFVILGVLMFFLPLNSLHAKMEAEKRLYQTRLAQVYSPYQDLKGSANVELGNPGNLNSEGASNRLVRLKEFEIAEKRLSTIPTWPLDVQVVSRFIIIVLSVTAALIVRVLTNFLHI